jgi:zinc protease
MIIARVRHSLAAALLAAFLSVPAAALAENDTRIESFFLDNGLEIIVIPNHRVPAVSHMIWYRVGAADDPQGKSGLAHFHEHMMFQGTAKLKPGEYSDVIARNGGEENAFTGFDATSYYINISKEFLPLAMELEADRMRGLKPSEEGTKKEKEVIIEERRMRVDNNPEALLGEQVNASLFRNHPYQVPIIGWKHEMEGLAREDVLAFHKKWYHPNNAMLIVSGDVTGQEVRRLAQKYYGSLPKGIAPSRRWMDEPPQNIERRLVMHHVNVKHPSWSRDYMAPSTAYGNKEQAIALFVLAQLLGEGKSSRLYQSIVVEQKLATAIWVDYNGFTMGPSVLSIGITPEQGVDLGNVEKALDKELQRAVHEGFSDEELNRAKTLLKAETIYARDGLTGMARIMGWLRICGLDKDYFTRWPELIDAVTVPQINQAAKETLQITRSVTATLLPQEELPPAGQPGASVETRVKEAKP